MPALIEPRVLEGPNLCFPRAATKLTLDVTALSGAPEDELQRLAARMGIGPMSAGAPLSGFRQRSLTRLVTTLVRRTAVEAGTTRLGVRVRPTSQPRCLEVAYPWRDRNRARELGERGPRPPTIGPRVPVVAVTGTNAKTTTSRVIAHIAREAGHLVGWSNTDGIYVDGELVEARDYSGPSGAGRVLAHPQVAQLSSKVDRAAGRD